MEQEPNDVIVLSAISNGAKKFDKIAKVTKISNNELNDTLQRLEGREMVVLIEKMDSLALKRS
jgi:DNA-binding HxlR family transcriptional regulator